MKGSEGWYGIGGGDDTDGYQGNGGDGVESHPARGEASPSCEREVKVMAGLYRRLTGWDEKERSVYEKAGEDCAENGTNGISVHVLYERHIFQ